MSQPAANNTIPGFLESLRVLAPPNGVLLVGAGTGNGKWVQLLSQWQAGNVFLVEADSTQFQHLQRTVQHEGWHLCEELIAEKAGASNYYQASNIAESGLLQPESLNHLWPNIKTRQTETREAITLANLQQESGTPSNWLIIDCLPALPIIQGAADTLSGFEVIVVRALLDDSTASESTAHQRQLEAFLNEQGYRHITTEAERHPAIGHALFVRDTQTALHELKQRLSQTEQSAREQAKNSAKQAEEHTAKINRLIEDKTTAEKKAAEQVKRIAEQERQLQSMQQTIEQIKNSAAKKGEEYTAQFAQLNQVKIAAEKQAKELDHKIEQLEKTVTEQQQKLSQSQNELARVNEAHAAQFNQLIQAKDAADKLIRELREQLESSIQCKTEQLNQLTQAKAHADKLAHERLSQVDVLQKRLQEAEASGIKTNQQHQLLQAEIARAEAQIELIRETLLRDTDS